MSTPPFNKPAIPPTLGQQLIAQYSESKNNVGVPDSRQNETPNNGLPQLFGAGVGGAVVVTALFKLFEKYGTNVIDGQKNKLALELKAKELELEVEKAERLAARKEEESKGELIKSTLNTALSNVYQSSRESREIYYALVKEIETSKEATDKGLDSIISRLEIHERKLEAVEMTLKDVLAALQLKERQSKNIS